MKKHLLTTSAVALAAILIGANPANAQSAEWRTENMGKANMEITVGGHMQQYLGFADNDDSLYGNIPGENDYQTIDIQGNTEINVLAEATIDSGLTFGGFVAFDGDNSFNHNVERSYLFGQGSFGRVMLGSAPDAMYMTHFKAPNVGININADGMNADEGGNEVFNWVRPQNGGYTNLLFPALGTHNGFGFYGNVSWTPAATTQFGDVFSQKIAYMSPKFGSQDGMHSFQIGASYAPDLEFADIINLHNEKNELQYDDDVAGFDYENIFTIGANYEGTFSSVDLGLSLGYLMGSSTNDANLYEDPRMWNAGLNIGYGGFTFGAAYGSQRDGFEMTNFTGFAGGNSDIISSEGSAWEIGLAYESGPFGVSLNYFDGDVEGDVCNATAVAGDACFGEDETQIYQLSGMYKLGSGVDMVATLGHAEYDDEIVERIHLAPGDDSADNEGTYFVLGTRITF